MTETATLVLKNDSSELGRLAEAVEQFSERHGLAPEASFQLQLCLEELVLNIVNYGFDGAGEHDIRVDLEMEPGPRVLTVRIMDDGREFNPLTEVAEPDLEASLEERAVGGLGVYLVRTLMDDVSYRREDGRNHLTLVKNLGAG